jgi:cell division septum initiation protein DivIVA
MKDENDTKGVLELWGQVFKRANNGLDEEQIVTFIDKIISERDSLIQKQEHLSSLSMLAERTIAEADNVANQIKADAELKAKQEVDAIIAQAEEQTKKLIEEKKTEATSIAEKEAESIRLNAKKEVELIREKETEKIHSELKSTAQQLYGELLSQLENLVKQVTEAEANFEQTLTDSKQQSSVSDMESNDISLDTDWYFNNDIKDVTDNDKVDHVEKIDEPEPGEIEEEPVFSANEPISYEGMVELEIMPPIEMRKVMEIISYLDSMSEVTNTELIPLADRPIVKVLLKESVNLIDILKGLPEVEKATETIEDVEDNERKIQIVLSDVSMLGEKKSKFTDEILNILSQN